MVKIRERKHQNMVIRRHIIREIRNRLGAILL